MTDIFFDIKKHSDHQKFLKGMELLYFGYRDFISWPDDVLQKYGFGRAHHRVLHFVGRNPGLKVAELLDLLNITKQSLSRVLSALVEKGYIRQDIGAEDRRQRLLNLTEQGEELLGKITEHQKEHMLKAFAQAGEDNVEGFWKVLSALINEENREKLLGQINQDMGD
ncbi:MarR family winged helix-turn-helix transcriptional regulator [Paremcibacter congregatus]|uniref:MarR family transcriptional regulator n=1 Tax=Paremcibacter congregatus TaxID=2043170 RepID=A0A2G4YV78_9PROT|nr:MarR family transcriptional regulator [Paremcibacter congregatus]PHZ86254.1 MarR family transcriptional regulator [Paremcibacter congregatus]QDE27221.1 MarR family transcriptional regulator [Paremcibacter congregatus]|tara:strand:- start:88 stop:588 length:501 start_codon:yes stop_codon:yes gene_type:complete